MSIATDLNLILNTPLFNPLYWIIGWAVFRLSRFIQSKELRNLEEMRTKRIMNDDIETKRLSNRIIPEVVKKVNEPKKESSIIKWIKKEGWK